MSQPTQRIDRWLWFARMTRTRSQATRLVTGGAVRVNGLRTVKPGQHVAPGDVLTFVMRGEVRVLRVVAAGTRRGPSPEARQLYEDLAPSGAGSASGDASRTPGA